ncbi:MAG: preprotein translocase subunit SecG [Alphaproteobacteria bacterium]|nr:preprotein translocase subunit SecG [Alphaproteobacteria bacterium]
MTVIVLVIHLILATAMIGVVLIQKSEGGGLGMGGGGGMSGFMTGRSTANLLTRTTALLAAGFFATSIVLAFLAGGSRVQRSIVDQVPPVSAPAPAAPPASSAPATPAAPAPAEPSTPSVPLAK